MMDPHEHLSGFLEALRNDLPSAEDDTRMRQRLQAMGVAIPTAGATAAAVGASAWAWWTKVSVVAALVTAPPALLMMSAADETADRAREVSPLEATSLGARHARPATSKAMPEPTNLPAERTSLEHLAPRAVPSADAPRAVPSADTPLPHVTPRGRSADRATTLGSRRTVPSKPAPIVSTPSTLAEETALIERALAAIEAGDLGRAQQTIDDHAQRFPQGELRRERMRAQQRLDRRLSLDPAVSPKAME